MSGAPVLYIWFCFPGSVGSPTLGKGRVQWENPSRAQKAGLPCSVLGMQSPKRISLIHRIIIYILRMSGCVPSGTRKKKQKKREKKKKNTCNDKTQSIRPFCSYLNTLSFKRHCACCPFWKNHHEYNCLFVVQLPCTPQSPWEWRPGLLCQVTSISDLEAVLKIKYPPLVSVIYTSTGRTQPQVRSVIPTAGSVHAFLRRATRDWRAGAAWGRDGTERSKQARYEANDGRRRQKHLEENHHFAESTLNLHRSDWRVPPIQPSRPSAWAQRMTWS